jgi:hypothetical protein
LAGQLHFLLSMTAAREIFAKSYFALGVSEKAAVDQMVSAHVAGNFQHLTPALLSAQQGQQPVGFGILAARTKAGNEVIIPMGQKEMRCKAPRACPGWVLLLETVTNTQPDSGTPIAQG